MDIVNVARSLQVGSDERALTQTLLNDTVAEAFDRITMLYNSPFIGRYSLGDGTSSHDFPIVGNSPEDGVYHIPGQFIEGGTTAQAFLNIFVDDPWIKALRLPYIDQVLARWDVVAKAARECGRITAERLESMAIRMAILAARTGSVANVHDGGNRVIVTNAGGRTGAFPLNSTGADAFEQQIATLARQMDEDNLPRALGDRIIVTTPYMVQVLTNSNRLTSADFTNRASPGGVDISTRAIGTIHGFAVMPPTNFMPTTNITTDLTRYNGNFSAGAGTVEPVALALVRSSNGAAVAMPEVGGGVNSLVYPDSNRDSTLVRTRVMFGMGVWCPWLAGEIGVQTS